jgi:hypothetical protein
MRNSFPWIVAGLVLALVCGAAGAFVTLLARAAPEARGAALSVEPPRAAGSDPALSEALANLAREFTALRAELERQSAQRAPSDGVVGAANANLEALLARVASALEGASGLGESGLAASQTFSGELRTRPFGADDPRTFAALQVASAVDDERLLSEHRYLSYQLLLQKYGAPDRISADGPTCTFVYEVEEGQQVGFKLYGGIVIDVWN